MKEVLAYVLIGAIISPIVTYFCVKFGTFAFLNAKHRYEEDLKENKRNGD